MVCNLKDTLVSLHNFCGAAIDGILGNNLKPGSLEHFVDVDGCPNATGSAFLWVHQNAKAVRNIRLGQALVVFYEQLVRNFVEEVQAVKNFLGLALLTDARVQLIEGVCGLGRMRNDASFQTGDNCCKGRVGGWRDVRDLNNKEHWSRFNNVFDWVLGGWRSCNLTLAMGVDASNICST